MWKLIREMKTENWNNNSSVSYSRKTEILFNEKIWKMHLETLNTYIVNISVEKKYC